jgi:hypothetical protein
MGIGMEMDVDRSPDWNIQEPGQQAKFGRVEQMTIQKKTYTRVLRKDNIAK